MIPFALEDDGERQESAETHYAFPVNPAIPRLSGHLHLLEARLTQQTLAQALEGIGRHHAQASQRLVFPILF